MLPEIMELCPDIDLFFVPVLAETDITIRSELRNNIPVLIFPLCFPNI
jgi:hypothetical protein